jgi:site-specific DNA-methyltransferase (adenine-specific)
MEETKKLELNKIYCMDDLDLLKQMPDKSVDLILTDPPYGINASKGVGGFGSSPDTAKIYDDDWDNKTPEKIVFDEMLRVGKKVIIFGGNYFLNKLPLGFKSWIVWDKIGSHKFNNPFSDVELAWTNFKGVISKKYTVVQQGFVSEEKQRFHPTQKPVKLFREIIKDNTKKGDVVLDCFCGSGTTAIACKQLGLKYICADILEKYVDIANKRLNQSVLTSIPPTSKDVGILEVFL